MLANQGGLEPFFDQPLARPRDRVDTGLQRRRDLAVAPALTTVRGVGFQQDPGLQQLLCWMVSAMDQGGEMPSLLIAQCHYVCLYRDIFPGHQSAPSAATEPSNQTNTAESMTGATRLGIWLKSPIVGIAFHRPSSSMPSGCITLSYRDVEELLADRGLDISYESVRS